MEKKPILNIMVDLETASTKENAAILSWAMVPFFTDGSEFTDMEDFYRVISLTSCFLAGMDFDKDTQKWWLEQDPKARGLFLHAEDANIHGVASEAYTWLSNLSEKYDLYLWARGLDFDIPKMEWCFRKFVERPLPYKYSHKMDVRTVLKFMQIDQSQFEMQGVKHNALDDCKHDIRMIQEAYKWKEKWMMAYTAVEAGKTAKRLKAEHSKKEAEDGNDTYKSPQAFLQNLSAFIGMPLSSGNSLYLSWDDVERLDRYIQTMNEFYAMLKAENELLKQQLKDLQTKA